MFDYNEDKVVLELKTKSIKLALLQLPEGLKKDATWLVKKFESETNTSIIVSGETCWGGCDLALDEAKNLGADLLIHYGHAPFIKRIDFPVLYIELKDKTDLIPFLKKSLENLKQFKKIGLVSSVQHVHELKNVKKFYEDNSIKVIIPSKKGYAHYDGHVVGCEYNSLKLIENEVDAYLVIGNTFHSLGASLSIKKPVILLDVYNNEITDMTYLRTKVIKQRYAAIELFKQAKKIGILVGLKPGQNFGSYKVIKDKFDKAGKESIIITMSEISNDKLFNFYDVEAFVELACPRIAVEDYAKYSKPLLTFKEALVAIGDNSPESLMENGFL